MTTAEKQLKFEILKEAHSLGLISDKEYKEKIATMMFLIGSIDENRLKEIKAEIAFDHGTEPIKATVSYDRSKSNHDYPSNTR